MLRYIVVGFVLLLAGCSASKQSGADLGFTTEIGVDGLPRLVSVAPKKASTLSDDEQPAETLSNQVVMSLHSDKNDTADIREQEHPSLAGSYNQSVFAADDEFIESDVLEESNFNPEDKKKFAWVPDGSGISRPFFYEDGEGAALQEYRNQETHVQRFHEPTLLPPSAWPSGLSNLSVDISVLESLSFNKSYKLGSNCGASDCDLVLLGIPADVKGYIRLRTYLSQLSCARCVQIPRVAIIDNQGKVQRVYDSEALGFRAESWRTFASFFSDITIDGESDKALVLIPSEERQFNFLNKNYKNVAMGEVSIKRI